MSVLWCICGDRVQRKVWHLDLNKIKDRQEKRSKMYKINKCFVAAVLSASMVFMPASRSRVVAKVSQDKVSDVVEEKVVILNDMTSGMSYHVNKDKIKCLKSVRKNRVKDERTAEIKKYCGVNVSDEDRRILERIVEAEAGGEDHKGKVLVANVVLNRVKSKEFPSTISGVVFAHSGSVYQFSPIGDGRYYSVTVSKDTKSAVNDALNGVDPSQGALYFMERAIADSHNVSWFDSALTRLFRYHCHEFYV